MNASRTSGLWIVAGTLWFPACRGETPEQARQEARKIWGDRCVRCHGEDGTGRVQGLPAGVSARDFTSATWQQNTDDERIRRVIVEGGQSVELSPLMPANPDLASHPAVVEALVEHVRGFAAKPATPRPAT